MVDSVMEPEEKDKPVLSAMHKAVGVRIKSARQRKGMDQLALAQLVGYKHASAITQIEKGTMNTTLTKLQAIAQALEKNVVDFFPDGHVDARVLDDTREAALLPLYEAATSLPPHILNLVTALMLAIQDALPPFARTSSDEREGVA